MQPALSQKAYDYIVGKMRSGELPPGARLVNRTLARQIGMSAIPVREAISRLASEGLVSQVTGASACVRRPDPHEFAEMYGLREAIESYAAAEAARNITEPELHTLTEVCDQWRQLVEELGARARKGATTAQVSLWLDCEERFHGLIITAARNRWLTKTVRSLQLLAHVFDPMRRQSGLLLLTDAEATWRQHEELVGALRRRDAEAARRLMSAQIVAGLQRMLAFSEA